MDYQIISANADNGQIEVLYKQDGVNLATYAIDVPIVNGSFLTVAELDAEIQHRAPTWINARKQELASATGFDKIVALVQPITQSNTTENSNDSAANIAMWEQVEFEKKVAAALVKFNVLAVDPTTIAVSTL
jgi:hypothetical protein